MGTKLDWDKNKRRKLQHDLQKEAKMNERIDSIILDEIMEGVAHRNLELSKLSESEKRRLYPDMYANSMFSPIGKKQDMLVECSGCEDVYKLSEMTLKYTNETDTLFWGCRNPDCFCIGFGVNILEYKKRDPKDEAPFLTHRQMQMRAEASARNRGAQQQRKEQQAYEKSVSRCARENDRLHKQQLEHKRRLDAMKDIPPVEYHGKPYVNQKRKKRHDV
jgi:hypothetical protein